MSGCVVTDGPICRVSGNASIRIFEAARGDIVERAGVGRNCDVEHLHKHNRPVTPARVPNNLPQQARLNRSVLDATIGKKLFKWILLTRGNIISHVLNASL